MTTHDRLTNVKQAVAKFTAAVAVGDLSGRNKYPDDPSMWFSLHDPPTESSDCDFIEGEPLFTLRNNDGNRGVNHVLEVFSSLNGLGCTVNQLARSPGHLSDEEKCIYQLNKMLRFVGVANTPMTFERGGNSNNYMNPPSVQISGTIEMLNTFSSVITAGTLLSVCIPNRSQRLKSSKQVPRRTKVTAMLKPFSPVDVQPTMASFAQHLGVSSHAQAKKSTQKTQDPLAGSFAQLAKYLMYAGAVMARGHPDRDVDLEKLFGLKAIQSSEIANFDVGTNVGAKDYAGCSYPKYALRVALGLPHVMVTSHPTYQGASQGTKTLAMSAASDFLTALNSEVLHGLSNVVGRSLGSAEPGMPMLVHVGSPAI